MTQGGVIGKENPPSQDVASGLWRLEELFRARLGGNWPSAGLIDFIYTEAKNDIAGEVFAYDALGRIDPASAEQTPGLLAEVEIFHYSLATFPTGLSVASLLEIGEDADKPGRVTALVVDGPLTLQAQIRVTNDRSRLAFAVLSRDDVDVGDGRNIVQPRFTYAEEPDATEGYRPYILSKFAPEASRFLKAGGDSGRGGGTSPTNPDGQGGSGGVAFGGTQEPWPQPAVGTGGGEGGIGLPPNRGGGGGGGGSPIGVGGSAAGGNGSPGNLPVGGPVILAGNNVTIPPSGTIVTSGGPGGPGGFSPSPLRGGGGGGGSAGHPITIFHTGVFVNNGTLDASGGEGGSFAPGASSGREGGAGEITTAPVPSDVVQQ